VKQAGKGLGRQTHHLIEKRFKKLWPELSTNLWAAVSLTAEQHQVFTNEWRRAIAYGKGTASATIELVRDEARRIYKNHPDLLELLGLKP
jgi:hypothetical protein